MARASYRKSNEFFTFHNENPKGRLTVGESGMIIDTWDCGTKCAGNYWMKIRE